MPHMIRVPADASAVAIQTTLAGTRAHDIALAFPLGVPCCAGTVETMRGLHAQCVTLQKDVVILGGDEHLRAVAVAAGFPAATSLAEWEATQPSPTAFAPPLRNMGDELDEWDEWNSPRLSLVPFEDERDTYGDPFDPFNDVLPGFVLELMARGGAYGAPDQSDDDATGREAESPAEDPLRDAHERYEEHITRAIRHTGGLSLSRPTHPPIFSPIAPFSTISSNPLEDTDHDSSQAP